MSQIKNLPTDGRQWKFKKHWKFKWNKFQCAASNSSQTIPYWIIIETLECLPVICNIKSINFNQVRFISPQQQIYWILKWSDMMNKSHTTPNIYTELPYLQLFWVLASCFQIIKWIIEPLVRLWICGGWFL